MDSYKLFISYAHDDVELMLLAAYQVNAVPGARAMYDDGREGIRLTDAIRGRLEKMIAEADCVIFIMTMAGLASRWVTWELEVSNRLQKPMLCLYPEELQGDLPDALSGIRGIPYTKAQLHRKLDELQSWVREQTGDRMAELQTPPLPEGRKGQVIALLASGPLDTRYGPFAASVFHDGHQEAVVLHRGVIEGGAEVPCRVHSECLTSHVFSSTGCDCVEQMQYAQQEISRGNFGIIIYLRQEGRGNGSAAHIATLSLKVDGMDQAEAYRKVGFANDTRTYDIAGKILNYFGITSIRLMSANREKQKAVARYGIAVSRYIGQDERVIALGRRRNNQANEVANGQAESPLPKLAKPRVFVVGDVNVDYVSLSVSPGSRDQNSGEPEPGGTAYNACKEFQKLSLSPVLVGRVGDDANGRMLEAELRRSEFPCMIARDTERETGWAILSYDHKGDRKMLRHNGSNNANNYDFADISQALTLGQLCAEDILFLVGHPFARLTEEACERLVARLAETKAAILLDVVPHDMHIQVKPAGRFLTLVGKRAKGIICELPTMMKLCDRKEPNVERCSIKMAKEMGDLFGVRWLILRSGEGNCDFQQVFHLPAKGRAQELESARTGFAEVAPRDRVGFGDRLTARLLKMYAEQFLSW